MAVQMSFGPKLEHSATRICMSLCTMFGVFNRRGVARVKKKTLFSTSCTMFCTTLTLIYAPNLYQESLWVHNYMVIYYQNTRGNANNRDASANLSKLGHMNQSRPGSQIRDMFYGPEKILNQDYIRFAWARKRFKFWAGTLRRVIQ